jgi:hypothetical protein
MCFTRSVGLASLAVALIASTGLKASSALAQTQDNIPVIVMLEDSDTHTVKRSSDINKRTSAALKDSMFRHGFRMIDEEMLAVGLGWKVNDRRPKTELIEAATLANSSGKANMQSRALALYRIHAYKQDVGFANKLEVRVDGELYDLDNNTFLGNFELPLQQYPAPADCNASCISEIVGAKASDMALSIGDVLGSKLAYLSPRSAQASGVQPVNGGSVTQSSDPRCQNMVSSFTLNFRRFEQTEIYMVMNTMTNNGSEISVANSFPCFMSSNLMDSKPGLSSYSYTSTATKGKLKEWIDLILVDAGFTPNRDVAVILNGNEITLDKLITQEPPMDQVPAGSKFN